MITFCAVVVLAVSFDSPRCQSAGASLIFIDRITVCGDCPNEHRFANAAVFQKRNGNFQQSPPLGNDALWIRSFLKVSGRAARGAFIADVSRVTEASKAAPRSETLGHKRRLRSLIALLQCTIVGFGLNINARKWHN